MDDRQCAVFPKEDISSQLAYDLVAAISAMNDKPWSYRSLRRDGNPLYSTYN